MQFLLSCDGLVSVTAVGKEPCHMLWCALGRETAAGAGK